jgi:hypothetical protein
LRAFGEQENMNRWSSSLQTPHTGIADGAPPADTVITPLYGNTPTAREALAAAFTSFRDDKRKLDGFRREVAKVRRVMANVPTYMICDDHDVTDDWFMTGATGRRPPRTRRSGAHP